MINLEIWCRNKEAGFYGYIIKPIGIKKFFETVDNALDNMVQK